MPTLQTAIGSAIKAGAVGRRANMEEWNTITRTAGAAIGFAQPVLRSGDDGCKLVSAQTVGVVGANGVPAPAGATIVASQATGGNPQNGVYALEAITAGATARWSVYYPDGSYAGSVVTGTPNTNVGGLSVAITDTGTDPAIGERFIVTVSSDLGGFLGLTETDTTLGRSAYALGDNVAICESGVIWALAGGTVTRGQRVYWDVADGMYLSSGGWLVPGAEFDSSGGDGDLVKIRLRRPVGV